MRLLPVSSIRIRKVTGGDTSMQRGADGLR
jgi:hypothetical protein